MGIAVILATMNTRKRLRKILVLHKEERKISAKILVRDVSVTPDFFIS